MPPSPDLKDRDLESFAEFWPVYLGEHTCVRCRAVHYLAATAALATIAMSCCMQCWWLLLLTPVLAYGLAWFGHFAFEGNRPATWVHPWWSLRAEARMFWLAITGRLGPHLEALDSERDD